MAVSDCLFCGILAGDVPSSVVYRDELVSAFMDIRPVNPGHVLVIPVRHAAFLAELDEQSGGHLFRVGQRVAQALRGSGLRCEGVNFHLADGAAAGQQVFHVHLHVFPRFKGDGFGLRFGPLHGETPGRNELDAVAEQLRQQM